MVRMGGPVSGYDDPDSWVAAVLARDYRAAYCPVDSSADHATVRAYADAALQADLVIAEVGAWSNPISRDDLTRHAAFELCCRQLDLADRIGALCCVNISGARGEQWDGPHPDNLTSETFDLIVESVRGVIDAVRPVRAYYTLETMPWAYPDSADSYLALIKAIDRRQFAVHLDPVNLVCSPQLYFRNGDLIRECFAKLGPHIKGVHAKDIQLDGKLTVHLSECRPGAGALDYPTLLREMDRRDTGMPLMLEHLATDEEYTLAAEYVRGVAAEVGVEM